MAVQFILGRSGSGKTSYCIEAIVKALSESAQPQLILLVPEQATYQAERAILADSRIAGYSRLNVLSFDRLQFLLSGKNAARPVLSRIGRQMIVHRILRDNKSKLKIFESSSAMPGLSRQMAHTLAELHEYAKTPQDIDQLLSELQKDERNSLAALKFTDIGLILREYLEFVEGKFVDPDLQLARACRAVTQASFVKGARLWVDGFAGFTTAEHAILAEMLKVAGDSQIALCLDPSRIDLANPVGGKSDAVSLFGPTERTYASLVETIKENKLKLAEPIILQKALRFSHCRPLAHIECNIFELEPPRIDSADSIRIVSAPNARAEVRFVARQILELVRDKDCRYRDIAVIASDIESYQHYIRAYFDDCGIPFFIDKRRPLNHHPVIQLVSSALQVVTAGFTGADIFAYLKTDLAATPRSEVDMLENYCLAFGISARDWQSDKQWRFAAPESGRFDEQRIDRIRHQISRPLLELQDRLCPLDNQGKTVSAEQFARAIFAFLDALCVKKTISGWISRANETKDPAAADEHQQFYNKFVDIFDELVEVFAGRTMTAEDYLAIVNSAFSQLTLAFIPPTLDQVLVGSIERSRHPDLKAVFLIGATQRQFPVPICSDSILTDDDRIAAESVGFQLAATSSQTLADRQYLGYIALTRPSQFLCITYPSADDKGSAVPRSQFMGDLESLFEDLRPETIASEKSDIEKACSEPELADLLCTSLGSDSLVAKGDYQGLLDSICSDEQLGQLGSDVLSAINYDNSAQLDAGVVKMLFGRRIRSSATRLSTFAACPYQHFARYTLQLREREEFKFEPLDLGRFYHRILDALTRRINTQCKDFATVDDDELVRLLREEITKLIKEDSFISNFVSRRGYNEFVIKSAGQILEDCVLAISEMVRAGSFRPRLSEVSFGTVKEARDTLAECEFSLEDNRVLTVDGKIDRLDIATVDGEKTAIVFDYKRKDTSFSWPKFYHGLDMQLPIYMLAVRNTAGAAAKNVAGAFYMPIEVSPAKTTLGKLSQKADSFDYKAKGIFDGRFAQQLDSEASKDSKFYNFYVTKDGQPYGSYSNRGALKAVDFEKVLQFAEEKIIQLAGDIASGQISVRPYRLSQNSPCGYCKYKSACRFDWQINDYNFLESVDKVQALERMGASDG
ncbi:MAG: exodeoxyribonuclease V subunit gamma [Phycisphaerae bacterium]|nr:exodeoxyribonuclease V subunit gamma [Phycisphaerae bacterium]